MASQERPISVLANIGDAYAVEAAGGAFLGNLSVAGRANLIIALALATLAAFAAINLGGENWLKASLQRQLAMQKIERTVADVAAGGLRMRRWETDFFLRNDLKDAEAYEADATGVLKKLETLARIPEAEYAAIHVDTLSDGIEQHMAQFKKVVNLERALGPSGREGHRGRLHEAARALQNTLDLAAVDNLTATVLLMRSHEKDFILDGSREHLRRMVELGNKFATRLDKAPLSAVDKARISLLMDAYLSDALAFGKARLSQDVEIKRLSEIFAYVAPNMEALADSASNSAAKARARLSDTRNAARYLSLAGSGGAGILFLVFGIGIARSITRPLSEVAAAARLVADGASSVVIPARQNNDEIGSIARSLGVIADILLVAETRRIEQEDTFQVSKVRHHEAIDRATEQLDDRVGDTLENMSATIAQLQDTAVTLSGTIGETGRGADAAAAAADKATGDFREVATVAETLTGIVAEVSRHATRSAEGAAQALSGAEVASARVRHLANAAREIGTVADSISEAAIQTNVLALDATVEASRGESAGPRTDLVANRINDLANQTTLATERITTQIGEIQRAAEEALGAVESLSRTVAGIDEDSGALVATVDRQRHTALDIARNVHRATIYAGEVSSNVTAVTATIGRAGGEANQILDTAGNVSRQDAGLRVAVIEIVETLRGGA